MPTHPITDVRFLGLSIACLLFIVLGHRYQSTIQAPLKKEFLRIGDSIVVDWWSISHAVYFAVLGWWFPNHFWFFLLFGTAWELIEDYLSKDGDTKLVNCENKENKNKFVQMWCNGIQDDYWYGKADDILMNTIGFLIGAGLKTYVFK
jgi:hypothetical protein